MPEVPEFNEFNEADFVIPEDAELAIWEENADYDELVDEVPYAPVPENLTENLARNQEEICIVCRDGLRTHALIPCGHKVLCADCIPRLEQERCPLCNNNFTSYLRIW